MVRHRMLAPINTVKHYVQRTNVSIANGALLSTDVVEAVVAPATSATNAVKEGSVIKAVFFEFWLSATGSSGSNTQVNVVIEKIPNGSIAMSVSNMLNLQAYPNKKNILWSSQGVQSASINGANAIPIIRQWMLLPKGKQRFGLADKLTIHAMPTGTTMSVCALFTYKEYT